MDSLRRIGSKFPPSQEEWAGRLCCLMDLLSHSQESATSCCDWSTFESLDNLWMNQPCRDSTSWGGACPCCMYPSVQQWAVLNYFLKQKVRPGLKCREWGSPTWQDMVLQPSCQCRTAVVYGQWRSSALSTVWLISLFISIRFITYQLYQCSNFPGACVPAQNNDDCCLLAPHWCWQPHMRGLSL